MKLRAKSIDYKFTKTDTIAIFITEEFRDEIETQIIPALSFVKENIDTAALKGKTTDSIFIPYKNHPDIVISGLGKKADINAETLRNSASNIIKACQKQNTTSLKVLLPDLKKHDESAIAASIAEGLSLSAYSFDKYKSRDENDRIKIKESTFCCRNTAKISGILKEIEITSENTILCRDLINETSDMANPLNIAKEARKLAALNSVKCSVYGKKEIQNMKMGLFLAVSRGSAVPPQFVVLEYSGAPKSKKRIALVGKGITYDSGGMNLKPSASIEDMRSDMAGAAACLYTLKAASELKLKRNITAVIPLCENMISNNAYRAGDVFTAYTGKTVEIGNTDAEGRLILADALAFTEKKIKPDIIIDIATLTGACLVALGETIAAVLATDDALADAIYTAGEKTGDRVWRLPFDKEYDEMLKSDIADIKNVGTGRNAGTIAGGSFLKSFIQHTPWAHIDIAGTSWYSKARGYRPKYATGFGVRLFIEYIKGLK